MFGAGNGAEAIQAGIELAGIENLEKGLGSWSFGLLPRQSLGS